VKKPITALYCMVLVISLIAVKFCWAEVAKIHTDEFLFVNSYLECLENYSKADYVMCIPIRFTAEERNTNSSAEEVINSDSMKQLKKEQEFTSKMVREMEKYSNSPVEGIKKVANKMLERYHKKQVLNVKAQETYFYTKTGKFKAGVLTADELFDERKVIDGDDYWQADEDEKSLREILFPGINAIMRLTYEEKRDPRTSIGSSVMRITYDEKSSLLEKTKQLNKRFSDTQHLGDWSEKSFLQSFERFLMIDFPCLKEVK